MGEKKSLKLLGEYRENMGNYIISARPLTDLSPARVAQGLVPKH